MIYGNKFLNYNVLNESGLSIDDVISLIENDINFINSYITESVVLNERASIVYKIGGKIEYIIERIEIFVKKIINLIRVKIVKLGNNLIKTLDDVIAGKMVDTESLTNEYNDVTNSMTQETLKDSEDETSTRESFLIESEQLNETVYVAKGDMNKLFYGSIGMIASSYLETLIDMADRAGNAFNKYLKTNGESDKKVIDDIYAEYEKYDINVLEKSMEENTQFIQRFNNEFNEFKSHKNKGEYKSRSGGMIWHAFEIKEIDDLKYIRKWIRDDIQLLESYINDKSKLSNDTLDLTRKVRQFHNKNTTDKYIEDKFAGKNSGEAMPMVRMLSSFGKVASAQYRALSCEISYYMYGIKNDYSIALRLIRKWGKTSNK